MRHNCRHGHRIVTVRRERRFAKSWQIRHQQPVVARQHVDVVRPVPPRSRTAVEQHQHRSLAPRPPHHGSVTARRFRSPRGPFEPVQKGCAGPEPIRSFIRFPFADIRGRLRTCRRDIVKVRPTGLRNARNHDDHLHRRHPPAMALRRTRPRITRSAAAGGRSARRHPVRTAARRFGRATARPRHRCPLDLRQPRQRRRPRGCGPTWSNPIATHAPLRVALHARVVEIAGVRIAGLGGTFRPRIWEPPEPPRVQRRAQLPEDLAGLGPGWREDHIGALIHSLRRNGDLDPRTTNISAGQRADVLVTHEGPRRQPIHPATRRSTRWRVPWSANLIVHGHHACLLPRHSARRPARLDGRRCRLGCHDRWRIGCGPAKRRVTSAISSPDGRLRQTQ